MASTLKLNSSSAGTQNNDNDKCSTTFAFLEDPGVRITYIGMACNFAMALVKLTGGWMFKSDIIVADGWHSMTDLTSDVLTLVTVSCNVKELTDSSPSTQIWIETLGSLGLSGMLIIGGFLQGLRNAMSLGEFYKLSYGFNLENLDPYKQDIGVAEPDLDAVWIAIATVILKTWLYHLMKVARSENSATLAFNAAHHRMDGLSGLVTILAVAGATLTTNARWIDPLGGLIISTMTLIAGIKAILSGH